MIRRVPSFTKLLYVSVCCIAALSACSGAGRLMDKITGNEGREPQVVDGGRRAPMLNPQSLPPADKGADAAPVRPVAPQMAQVSPTPFDSYDDEGNEVEADASSAEAKSTPDYFSQFFGQEKEKTEAAQPVAAPATDAVRKPISDNAMSVGTADRKDTVSDFAPVGAPRAAVQEEKSVERVIETAPPAPTVDEPVAEERPSFFSRVISPVKRLWSNDEKPSVNAESAPVTPVEKEMAKPLSPSQDYPALSSVPPTPSQFKAVKAEKDKDMEALTLDHALAQENKQVLDAEPSASQPTPVAAPSITPAPVSAPVPVAAKPKEEPVLLGHISDDRELGAVMSESPKADDSVPAPMSAPVVETKDKPIVKAPAATVAEEPSEPWWKRLNVLDRVGLGSESKEASPVAPAVVETKSMQEPAAAPVVVETPKPVMPAPVVEPRPLSTVPEFKPMEPMLRATPAPVEYRAAPLVPEAVPVAPQVKPAIATTESNDGTKDNDTTTTGSLPSPDTLKKVKTLPPSRYNSRARDRQYYLVP